MIYLSICLWIWLFSGFLTGIKKVFVDKKLSDKNLKVIKKRISGNETKEFVYEIMSKKSGFIAISTLFGFVAFYLDTVGTFSKEGDSN